MSASFQRRSGASTGRRRRRMISEINVTPMVDVMLVLLIIFMVTAPLLTTGVNIDLPRASAQSLRQEAQPITVTINAEGQIFVQETPVADAALAPRLHAVLGENPDVRIYVRGDGGVAYARVMEVMGMLRDAGIDKAALVTQPPKAAPRDRR